MERAFIVVLERSVPAGCLILAVLAVRFLLRKAPKSMRSFLWLLVGIRLVFPFTVGSALSLLPDMSAVDGRIYGVVRQEPVISSVPDIQSLAGPDSDVPGSLPATRQRTATVGQQIIYAGAGIWLFGIALMFLYMAVSWAQLRYRVRTAVPSFFTDDQGERIKIYRSDAIGAPFVFGIVRPRIFVPFRIADEDLTYVVLHERMHLKRKDHLIKPAGFLILCAYWFHPFVWIAYILFCKDIELICDEKVVRTLGFACKKAYSRALLACAADRRMVTACPVAFGEIGVRERVENVLQYKKPAFWLLVAAVLACIAVPVCFMTQQHAAQQEGQTSVLGQELEADAWVRRWAEAFCERDAGTIMEMAGEEVLQDLEGRELLSRGADKDGSGYAGFGWSSPWPWGDIHDGKNYRIVSITDDTAEILYYAWVSDPHVTVWRETLTYEKGERQYVVTAETLQVMDSIATSKGFYQAYPGGSISGTMMDYQAFNGAGGALDENARANREDRWYAGLFGPMDAAVRLLNLSDDPREVGVRIKMPAGPQGCTVRLEFYEDGSYVDVMMVQPYGEDGIWVPASGDGGGTGQEGIPQIASDITEQNIDRLILVEAQLLGVLFPDHHESMSSGGDVQYIDLDGDGTYERIEMEDLHYNGGDGGYALMVTDTGTGAHIPLPDGYVPDMGFPFRTDHLRSDRDDERISILLGEGEQCRTIVSFTQAALERIYERKGMYLETAQGYGTDAALRIDALSGCRVIYQEEDGQPVLVLKTYVSGFLGHVDTLGYVITELRLKEDHTWDTRHYFLLDGCADRSLVPEDAGYDVSDSEIFIPIPVDPVSEEDFMLLR